MKTPLSLALNNVELLKHALYKDYQFPPEIDMLNRTQERILMTIKYCPNLTMVTIARAIGIEKGPFSQSVDRLEVQGLVVRNRSIIDKRNVLLQLTQKGLQITAIIEKSMEQHFDKAMQKLNKQDRIELMNALESLKNIALKINSK